MSVTYQPSISGFPLYDKQKPRKASGRFASGFVVHDDLFALVPPAVVPVGAESLEQRSARVREVEARKGG